MPILELNYPGTSFVGLGGDTGDLESLLDLLTGQLADACIARDYLDREGVPAPPSGADLARLKAAKRRLSEEVSREYQPKLDAIARMPPGEARSRQHHALFEEMGIEFKRRERAGGEIPTLYRVRTQLLHARSILYALDTAGKALDALSGELKKHEGSREIRKKIRDIKKRYSENFPGLTGVRNSSHHMEDRVRGRNDKGKIPAGPLAGGADLGGLTIGPGSPVGRRLFLDNLIDDRLTTMMADGHIGTIDVSINSIEFLHNSVQDVINSFDWEGPRHLWP